MSLWGKVLALFVAAVVAVVFLKALPPIVVLAVFAAGVIYANHVLTVRPKREAMLSAGLPGFRAASVTESGLDTYPFALLLRPGVRIRDAVVGRWRGAEVRLFDLELGAVAPVDGAVGGRRFTGVLAPIPFTAPHLLAEPRVFLTPEDERPGLPVATVADERVQASWDVRCEDPAFASSFVAGRLAAWLLAHEDRVALEVRGPAVLLYQPWVPSKDRDEVLELLGGFMDAVPASRGAQP